MDADHQIALLLQEQFNHENTKNVNHNTDYQLAVHLQEEFNHEEHIENPGNNLVYDLEKKKDPNSSKSLIDPSWEVVDPTPDIHVLFMAFNERFFWNKLLSVCVSWSTRMTLCAGVCSYHGRGGLCKITLSEPLLKLRPRKDLVETLLHEMIHAYLFVTHNNKDRDGHGPEFHKHMYRINGEAGTNITVYHTFHDEVNVYKQHWWLCDGPCRREKPFFGVLRRSVNRPPGPRDFWWMRHQQNCGGTFIKIKEPEKKSTLKNETKIKNTKDTSKNDIRNFIPSVKTNSSSNKENTGSNIDTINNDNTKIGVTQVLPTNSNIHGFISGNATRPSKNAVKNSSSTITVNKTTPPKHNQVRSSSQTNVPPVNNLKKRNDTSPTSKTKQAKITSYGDQASSSNQASHNQVTTNTYIAVRNHWANKFQNTNENDDSSKGKKRVSLGSSGSYEKSPKLKKSDSSSSLLGSIGDHLSLEKVECPVCGDTFSVQELNIHLDFCITKKTDKLKKCIICGANLINDNYEAHVSRCADETFRDDLGISTGPTDTLDESNHKECAVCCKKVKSRDFDEHMKDCSKQNLSTVIDLTITEDLKEEKFCPVCEKNVASSVFESHIEECLHTMYDKMEEKYTNTNETTECLACNKRILKSELNSHLEECMQDVFKGEFVIPDGIDCMNSKYNCPFCMNLFSDKDMSSHIEECLNIVEDKSETELNKSIFLSSLSSVKDPS